MLWERQDTIAPCYLQLIMWGVKLIYT
jgi:hypothetical protein